MKIVILTIVLSVASLPLLSQEGDGVVSFDIPVRNSLMFNRYAINPTFSFVREQYKYVSIYNKRQWTQFNDAPLTYLASYSGRFSENLGAGIGLYQQNFGVLTTFGGVLNFAYNAQINRDSNLTFGLNIGAYSSGINTGNVTTNFPDPSLQNVPSNFLITVNPGINYGTGFLDFGVSVNNLFVYNLESSEMLEDDPNQGIQGHVMYTGYMSSRGFFDDARFSGLIRSEFTNEETIISANAMFYIPRGLWFQAGYNNRYGASVGAGINITKEIAIEYNYERGFGDLVDFGPSHDITLAYRFINRRNYDYSRQDEVVGLISTDKRPKQRVVRSSAPKRTIITPKKAEEDEAVAKAQAEEKANAEKLQKEKDEATRLAQLENEKVEAEEARLALIEQKRLEEAKRIARAKIEADKRAKALEEQKEKNEAEEKARLEQQRLDREKAAQAQLEIENAEKQKLAQEAADRLAKIEADKLEKEKQELEAKRLEEERLAKEQEEADLINNPQDKVGVALKSISDDIDQVSNKQSDLLDKYNKAVEGKNENLKELKEENDLSEQGIAIEPKEFKSVTKQNNELKAVKAELDEIIKTSSEKISELEELYEGETIELDEVSLFYKNKIDKLKAEQTEANKIKANLEDRLKTIEERIEFEKRRRIKRAEYDNEEERYAQDRAQLERLKRTTEVASATYEEDDFDFGIEQPKNIQILKNLNNVDNGYYLVLAVHNDTDKRDDFITKAIASGAANIEFFFDVNTSQYYIYQNKFQTVQEANSTLKLKGNQPLNSKMTIIKIEN